MKIKNVIFDLGAVLIEWNPEKIVKKFTNDILLQQRILAELYCHQDWLDFDCAKLTEKEIEARTADRLDLSAEETKELFLYTKESLVLIPEMLEVLKNVKDKKLNAYCLSNISPEFLSYLFKRYSFFNLFNGVVTSGKENIAKPNKQIFETLIKRYNLTPQECLFIDDREENTQAASNIGITAVTFVASSESYTEIAAYI